MEILTAVMNFFHAVEYIAIECFIVIALIVHLIRTLRKL
jgi:hypothetical protein